MNHDLFVQVCDADSLTQDEHEWKADSATDEYDSVRHYQDCLFAVVQQRHRKTEVCSRSFVFIRQILCNQTSVLHYYHHPASIQHEDRCLLLHSVSVNKELMFD